MSGVTRRQPLVSNLHTDPAVKVNYSNQGCDDHSDRRQLTTPEGQQLMDMTSCNTQL